eukprot:scaffold25813_cov62-Isochrysis_galbana.AAC.1
MRRSQSNPKKRSRIEKTQLNMPVRPDVRRNERQISDEKKPNRSRLQNWTAILRFVHNSTEILRNGQLSLAKLNSHRYTSFLFRRFVHLCASGGDERR